MARILTVEDSLTVRNTVVNLLEGHGHEVHVAGDGFSAFASLQNVKPHLIMLDIGLPGIGGIELCVAIRQIHGYSKVPIIMVTGSHKLVDIRLAHEFGANAYITKPFNEQELMQTVDRLLAEALVKQGAA